MSSNICKMKNLRNEKQRKEQKMKKGVKLFLVILTVTAFASSSLAQPDRRMRRGEEFAMRPPVRILWILQAKKDELKVTDSQIEKIKSLDFSFEEKMIQMRNQISLERLNLRKLMQEKENLDYVKIKAVLSRISGYEDDMFIEGLKLREEIQKILTPEQREAVKEAMKERLHERKFFRGREMFPQRPPMRDRIKK